jgi:hypothetical protein
MGSPPACLLQLPSGKAFAMHRPRTSAGKLQRLVRCVLQATQTHPARLALCVGVRHAVPGSLHASAQCNSRGRRGSTYAPATTTAVIGAQRCQVPSGTKLGSELAGSQRCQHRTLRRVSSTTASLSRIRLGVIRFVITGVRRLQHPWNPAVDRTRVNRQGTLKTVRKT